MTSSPHIDDRAGDDPDRRMEAFLTKHEAERLSEEDDEGMQFLVLEDDGVRDDRPIALWIHPGDACEHDHPDDEVRENAADFEHYMGEELLADDGYRMVVLHRQSTSYAFCPDTYRVADTYWKAMDQALTDPSTIHLWGDDLDEASKWLIDRLDQAPKFFLTGAWNHPKDVCVATVGKALVRAGKEVEVSMWSPSDPGSIDKTWRPELEKAKIAREEERKQARKKQRAAAKASKPKGP